ncbi:MAG TPA: hypothetical protein PLD88_11500, partial [Candidatus Berkiella sp.]|nr:hypothetical protein [Candidatus Berkiella sp.]
EQKSEIDLLREKLELLLQQCKSAQELHKTKIAIALKGHDLFHPSQIYKTFEKSLNIQLLALKLEQYSTHVNAILKINTFNIDVILKRFEENREELIVLLNSDSVKLIVKFAQKKAAHSLLLEEAKEKTKECKLQFEACQPDSNQTSPLSNYTRGSLALNMSLLQLAGNMTDLYSDLFETKSTGE